MGWMAALGGAAMASGSAANVIGAEQGLRSMRRAFNEQNKEEDAIEDDWRAKLRQHLDKSAPVNQAETYRESTDTASSQLNELTDALAGASAMREQQTGQTGAGRVTSDVGARVPRLRTAARAISSNIGARDASNQQVEDMVDISGERRGLSDQLRRKRALYPYRRSQAAFAGSGYRAAGGGLSQLGQALLLYSVNNPSGAGTGASAGGGAV